ncbi:SAM-dependent methyltransferase [Streptosporangium subroseum]|uniref:SAM-dependent methyltransferase n=1 Tax=Streptosporangium subroseum TaxID=106412 RepID=UPI00308CA2B8|nr:SAM-dependent methyltransferase [Streptosporangium subroseum]
MTEETAPQGVDPHIPNAARMYDYHLGGTTNFAADRVVGDMVLSVAPEMHEVARQGRELISAIYERANSPFVPRGREAIAGFFGDFEMIGPGLVNFWPLVEPPESVSPELASMGYSGVGRKL